MLTRSGNMNLITLPANTLAAMEKYIVRGAVRVPRTREACDLWVGLTSGKTGSPFGRGRWQLHRIANGVDTIYQQTAAAVMYRLFRLGGESIPFDMRVCHTCDVEACVNPDHLYLGTARMNGSDLSRRGAAIMQGTAALAVAVILSLADRGWIPVRPWHARAAARLGIRPTRLAA